MRTRLDLQPLFMCGAMVVAICFLMLPALFLPGWETPTAVQKMAHSVRGKFSIRNHLSAKHVQRLKRLFAKRKKGANSSFQVPDALSSEDEDELDEMFNKALAQHGARLTDIYSVLDKSAIAQAQMFGLVAAPPPPPRRGLIVTDEELVGPEPVGMFTLRHVSRSVCRDTGMDNHTLATTLKACAARCLLVNREMTGERTCKHFAWVPTLKQCSIYPSCKYRDPFSEKVKLYEKNMVHLREVGEGLCMEHMKDLSFVDHRTCDFTSTAQQWLYDPTLMVLKLASDMTQCLDFFPEHQDFGVWACHDSANHEFVYDNVGKLCQKKDKGSCVTNATAENFYLQLRLPGEASCFHFGGQFDGKTHLIIHRTCEERTEQWWQFERETLSFKHSTDSSVCLNWNEEKQGFDIWKCYNTPKQQFQFSKFRLTYCLRHDQHQCLQAVENLAGNGLQLRLPGHTHCLQYGDDHPLSQELCRVTFPTQRWLFESSTMRFRHGVSTQSCLHFDEEKISFKAIECAAEAGQKFHVSLGTDGRKYCIGKDERKCVQEATLGPELQLHVPMAIECLQFDGRMQVLQQADCNETVSEQKWVLDAATNMFRYSADVSQCLDYMEDEEAFSAEPCHDNTPGQRFEQKYLGQYCMSNRKDLCVQQSALTFKY